MFFQLFANRRKTIRFSMIRNRNANAFVQSNVSVNRKKICSKQRKKCLFSIPTTKHQKCGSDFTKLKAKFIISRTISIYAVAEDACETANVEMFGKIFTLLVELSILKSEYLM